ncbi:hypothetical protein HZS_4086 [Henneguya salminicola]|nr:hypothetical protein HZS_4086 [Henneguya salminicola]
MANPTSYNPNDCFNINAYSPPKSINFENLKPKDTFFSSHHQSSLYT